MSSGGWTAALDAFEAALESLERGVDVPLDRPELPAPSGAERARALGLLERVAESEGRLAATIADVAAELTDLGNRRAAARSYHLR